jgi:hypothetical protein
MPGRAAHCAAVLSIGIHRTRRPGVFTETMAVNTGFIVDRWGFGGHGVRCRTSLLHDEQLKKNTTLSA